MILQLQIDSFINKIKLFSFQEANSYNRICQKLPSRVENKSELQKISSFRFKQPSHVPKDKGGSSAFNYVSTIWGHKIGSLEFSGGDKINTHEAITERQTMGYNEELKCVRWLNTQYMYNIGVHEMERLQMEWRVQRVFMGRGFSQWMLTFGEMERGKQG